MRPGPSPTPASAAQKKPADTARENALLEKLRASLHARLEGASPLERKAFKLYTDGGVKLPPVPRVAALLLPLLNRPNSPIAACVELIEMDQALAGAMLRVANSVAYFRGYAVHNIRDAVMRIGFNEASCLAVGLSTRALYDERVRQALAYVGSEWEGEWRKAVVAAQASRNIAQRLQRGAPDLAYAAGLFQSVGYSLAAFILATMAAADPALAQMPVRTRTSTVMRMRTLLTGEYLIRENLPFEMCQTCIEIEEPLEKPVGPTTHVIRLTLGLMMALEGEGNLKALTIERALESARKLEIDRNALDMAKGLILKARESVEGLERNFHE